MFEHSFLACVAACRQTDSRLTVWRPAFSAVRQPRSADGPMRLFVDYNRSNINSHFRILFCSRQRRCSEGVSAWQVSLEPRSTFVFPLALAPILAFTLIYWNIPSSLTHSSLAAGRLFAGISDTPCPWITLECGEITAFCHLACQSLAASDRRWMCQTGEQCHSEKREGGGSIRGAIMFYGRQLLHIFTIFYLEKNFRFAADTLQSTTGADIRNIFPFRWMNRHQSQRWLTVSYACFMLLIFFCLPAFSFSGPRPLSSSFSWRKPSLHLSICLSGRLNICPSGLTACKPPNPRPHSFTLTHSPKNAREEETRVKKAEDDASLLWRDTRSSRSNHMCKALTSIPEATGLYLALISSVQPCSFTKS